MLGTPRSVFALSARQSSPKEAQWTAAIEAHLPSGYERLASRILVGMLIIVYVKTQLRPKITNLLTAAVGTGPCLNYPSSIHR